MRKIIYMGEFDGRNYYYNTRTKEGLVALDSETIKKKGEGNEYLSTLIMMLFWLFLILEALMFLIPVFHGMHYPKLMITPFIMLSIVTPLLYILLWRSAYTTMLTIPFFLPRRLFHRLYIPISFGIIFSIRRRLCLKYQSLFLPC